jgi:hypothetical protein
MEEAERIAREEHGSVKLAVISGKLTSYLLLKTQSDSMLSTRFSFVRFFVV